MSASTLSRSARSVLVPLVLTNGLTVSSLYWAQSVVLQARAEFGPSVAVSLMPGATLAGYATGVALLAAVFKDLTSPRALAVHLAFLVASLCAAALAPSASLAALACLCIGLGCALTQRLLTSATSAVAPERRAGTIGWIVAGGLVGILLARALVPVASAAIGWRALFVVDAILIVVTGAAACRACAGALRFAVVQARPPLPSPSALWRTHAALRRAAVQQGVVFAAFNLGWALFPRVLQADGQHSALPMGSVAALGAIAALLSGSACSRWSPAVVARTGLCAVALAVVAAILAIVSHRTFYVGMPLLDAGTQIALVANQARAQALATSPAMRGRLAAMVTTVGFAGGALGAAAGNLLH